MNGRILLAAVALAAIVGCGSSGPNLQAVRGTVHVNGQPAERVVVSFFHTDPAVTGNAAHPCTVTDANGAFQMSTDRDGDGAVPGEYLVAFTWPSNPDPDLARDLFNGSYESPQKSTFRARVVADAPTDLPVYELMVEPARVKEFVK
jgi:hypothetical protein